jgi:hypothetical protein
VGDYGINTSGPHEKMMINGTINLQQTIFEAIGSKVNTTLTQAITTAEQTTGNNSFALAAFGGPQGAYLVYTIILGTPGNVSWVISIFIIIIFTFGTLKPQAQAFFNLRYILRLVFDVIYFNTYNNRKS